MIRIIFGLMGIVLGMLLAISIINLMFNLNSDEASPNETIITLTIIIGVAFGFAGLQIGKQAASVFRETTEIHDALKSFVRSNS